MSRKLRSSNADKFYSVEMVLKYYAISSKKTLRQIYYDLKYSENYLTILKWVELFYVWFVALSFALSVVDILTVPRRYFCCGSSVTVPRRYFCCGSSVTVPRRYFCCGSSVTVPRRYFCCSSSVLHVMSVCIWSLSIWKAEYQLPIMLPVLFCL